MSRHNVVLKLQQHDRFRPVIVRHECNNCVQSSGYIRVAKGQFGTYEKCPDCEMGVPKRRQA